MKLQQQPTFSEEHTHFHFFFFINTKSGYGQGRDYFSHGFQHIKFKYESNRNASIYMCDLFNAADKQTQLKHMKKLIDENQKEQQKIRVIISGGDGTILWVVNEVINIGINPQKIVFGINPIGTGNDFSRSVGWGFEPLIITGPNFKNNLAKQILIWMNSEVGKYDLWDVQIQTYPDGEIYDIKNQVQFRRDQRKIQKMFSNYVGMGLDARVVYTVQRKRTKNAFINKVIYGCVGFCNFFRSLKKLDTLSFVSETATELSQKLNSSKLLDKDSSSSQDNSTVHQTQISDVESMITNVETMKLQKLSSIRDQQTIYKLKKGYRGVVCLNCPSYMCGLRHIWSTKKIAEQSNQSEHFKPQRFDDGQVEFIAYKNELDLALERIMRSGAKLAQGGGPFRLVVEQAKTKAEQDNFIQIDGQSIKVTNLKQVRIQRTDKVQGSQINIMFNTVRQ